MGVNLSADRHSPYARTMQTPTVTAEEDGALARRVLACAPERDTAAEAELCRRLGPRIRLFGLKHLRSEAAAADLVQDVLMMTLQKLREGAVREPERLASFVLGTARQMVIDARRNSARRERILDAFPVDFTLADEQAPEALDSARLRQCLQALPERERTVLLLTFYDDRSADAVGLELGLSTGNVRVVRHRGIDRLRKCMNLTEVAP
jgi:RNA polymerase sigma-70 factor (ECF subfamily)